MIVVYTPYGRSETTAAAVRLAELAVSEAHPTRLVAVGPHEARVHPFWDRHVLSGRNGGVQEHAKGAHTCVWFVGGEHLRLAARAAAPAAAHVYVPPWHAQPKPGLAGLPPYDLVVCPSRAQHETFGARLQPGAATPVGSTWANWDAGFPPVRHEGRAAADKVRVLAHCDGGAIDECPAVAVRIMAGLVERCPAVELTCWASKAWARRERRELAALTARWGERFVLAAGGTLQDQLGLMHDHDWFLYPAARCDFGLHAARAMHCGLPVVGWDVPPLSERVVPGKNGLLVACEHSTDWAAAPTADAVACRFIDAAAPALDDARRLFALQAADWGLKASADAFRRFWLDLFGAAC